LDQQHLKIRHSHRQLRERGDPNHMVKRKVRSG
jgi:hypothetical protein